MANLVEYKSFVVCASSGILALCEAEKKKHVRTPVGNSSRL